MANDPHLRAEFYQWLTNIKEVADLFDAWKAALVAARTAKCICDVHPWCPMHGSQSSGGAES
jgi:hypothetical protein